LGDDNEFLIKGVDINETTTLNNVKYIAEELEKAAVSFRNVPILLDHKNEVRNIVGRTTERVNWNPNMKRVDFEGRIMDKTIQEMIKDGRIGNVSIGAKVENLTEESDGSMKAMGIKGLEISLVAVPGDCGATLAHALENSFILKESANIEEDLSESKLNTEDKNMVEESSNVQTPVAEVVEAKVVEAKVTEEKTVVVDEKVNKELSEMKEQIKALSELLKEKKQIKEAMEDKTKGEVSVKKEEALKDVDNRIVEALGKGSYAIYRDYKQESADSNLKRLVR
jgi:hypothetical protein